MSFQVICEIEPPTRPDLKRVRHQIGVMTPIADSFLIPDNHIGRATVSSIAVAHEVDAMSGRAIACLNSRDRNLLGFRRDLLTAAAYGVDRFLFVYGDKPAEGGRTSDLTVRRMIEEARAHDKTFQVGTAAALRPLPDWKRAADFVFAQVCFSTETLVRWREDNPIDVPVYAGVMVIASERHAAALNIPGIDLPEALVERVRADRNAGVEAACEQVLELKESGAFDGVHLIPVARYREVAARLEGHV